MADRRDPILVGILEGRIRSVFGQDPVTYVWEIDSDHWYTLTQLAEELGGDEHRVGVGLRGCHSNRYLQRGIRRSAGWRTLRPGIVNYFW